MNHRNFIRPLNVLLLAVTFVAPIDAQTPLAAYTPMSARYRTTSSTQATQVMMGQTQESSSTGSQLTTVVIAKDASGLTLTMTLDSLAATSASPEPAPDVSTALGMTFSGVMAPDGRVTDSKVTDKSGSATDSPFAASLRSFLPRLKVGATPGATWSDTTTTSRAQNGGTVSTSVVSNYTLVGDTTVAGARGWKLVAVTAGTVSGAGNQNGADFTIKGSITGGGTFVVGAGASLVSADLSSDATMLVDVPMAGLQIPITQKQSTRISRLP